MLDGQPQTVLIKEGDAQQVTFYNKANGGVEIIKVDASDKTKRLANVTFEIRRMDGGLVDTVTTGADGRVQIDLDAGDYYALEIEAAEGYKLDATPNYFTVVDGKPTSITITNKAFSGILLHKIDSGRIFLSGRNRRGTMMSSALISSRHASVNTTVETNSSASRSGSRRRSVFRWLRFWRRGL